MQIKCNDLLNLLDCHQKYKIQQLSLKLDNKRYYVIKKSIQLMAKNIADNNRIEQIKEKVQEHINKEYSKSWFLLSWQRDDAVKRDYALFERFLDCFNIPTEAEIKADVSYIVPYIYNHEKCSISEISICADLVINEQDGPITGVIIKRKFKKPFSYRASKHENKVQNSIELLLLLKALSEQYPERQIIVKMVSLVSKMDKTGLLAQFNTRPGDNIIEIKHDDYLSGHPAGIVEGIREIIGKTNSINCKDCIHEELCRNTNKIFLKQKEGRINRAKKPKMKFTNNQLKVINHDGGPIRVSAGPGSGKTATFVKRIEHLISIGVPQKEILAITFTKKAAQEIKERLIDHKQVYVSTLHSLAQKIISEHEFLTGKLKLVSKVDCMSLLLSVLNSAPKIKKVSYDGLTMKFGLINRLMKDFSQIDKYGEALFRENNSNKDVDGILVVKELYKNLFISSGYITFDDQITLAVNLLQNNEIVRQNVHDTYSYVLVDEAQDLDENQFDFIRLLISPEKNNIMITGDANQEIYKFREASNEFMLSFTKLYPDAVDIWLTDNFRSSREIVTAAEALIQNNKQRIPMELQAKCEVGFKPIHLQNFRTAKMGVLIWDIIKKGYKYGDIAIIATENKMLSQICDIIDSSNEPANYIPYERPKYYLHEDFVFQSIADLLDLYVNGMNQDIPLYRILTSQGCSITKTNRSLTLYEDFVNRNLVYQIYDQDGQLYLKGNEDETELMQIFRKIYSVFQVLKKPLNNALGEICELFFDERVNTEEVLNKLLELIYERRINRAEELLNLMKNIKLFQDDTRLHYEMDKENVVHLLTAHDAKGSATRF